MSQLWWDLQLAAAHLKTARRVLFITGAGVSADAGLSSFYGLAGLPVPQTDAQAAELQYALSRDSLACSPEITWSHLRQMEARCRAARPSAAHAFMAWYAALRAGPQGPDSPWAAADADAVWVCTQNVEGLHQRASSRNVAAVRGTLWDLRCTHCGYRAAVGGYAELPGDVPSCPECEPGILRPDITLLGETGGADALASFQAVLRAPFDLVVAAGSSANSPYLLAPVQAAKKRQTPIIEINPAPTAISGAVDLKLAVGAADACQVLRQMLGGEEGEEGEEEEGGG